MGPWAIMLRARMNGFCCLEKSRISSLFLNKMAHVAWKCWKQRHTTQKIRQKAAQTNVNQQMIATTIRFPFSPLTEGGKSAARVEIIPEPWPESILPSCPFCSRVFCKWRKWLVHACTAGGSLFCAVDATANGCTNPFRGLMHIIMTVVALTVLDTFERGWWFSVFVKMVAAAPQVLIWTGTGWMHI